MHSGRGKILKNCEDQQEMFWEGNLKFCRGKVTKFGSLRGISLQGMCMNEQSMPIFAIIAAVQVTV